jgi:CobW/HypB/UreG, nucleotide-binding domain
MIEKNSLVTLNYTMMNGRGEVLENRRTTYLQGSSAISPILQAQLEGLEPGQTKKVFLKKGQENADDDFTFDILIESVRRAMQIHLLSGFLGSGKTTAIAQACGLLSKSGIPTAIISNDQGDKLVDGAFFDYLGIPARQVTNGCFCCNYNELDRCILSLTGNNHPAILFAESVGSCTDLVATVLKPLLEQYPGWRPTVSVFADANLVPDILEDHTDFDPAVRYIYLKQLEEAQVIVVTKTDQVADEAAIRHLVSKYYPAQTILYQNSFDSDHILHWLQTLEQLSSQSVNPSLGVDYDLPPSLNIDYELYGAGEAKLAWLDQQLVIESPSNNAQSAALTLVTRLSQTTHPIGHLKCLIDGAIKISFTSTGTTRPILTHSAASASLLINARIQTTPDLLFELMADAIQATEKAHDCTIRTLTATCFQPGFPRPTHRIP